MVGGVLADGVEDVGGGGGVSGGGEEGYGEEREGEEPFGCSLEERVS